MDWRVISQEEWQRFAHQEESACRMMEKADQARLELQAEADDGDDLNWEYDPNVKDSK
jgi:hypothetical protein